MDKFNIATRAIHRQNLLQTCHNFDLPWRDGSPIFVTQWPLDKVQHFIVAQINKDFMTFYPQSFCRPVKKQYPPKYKLGLIQLDFWCCNRNQTSWLLHYGTEYLEMFYKRKNHKNSLFTHEYCCQLFFSKLCCWIYFIIVFWSHFLVYKNLLFINFVLQIPK